MKKLTLFLAVLIIAGIGGYIARDSIFKSHKKALPSQIPEPTTPAPKQVIVTLTDKGFVPQKVRVQTGGIVFWVNKSGKTANVNSNDYPTNRLYPKLNLGKFDNGSTVQLLFDKSGTYGYHNYLNPKLKGTVRVE